MYDIERISKKIAEEKDNLVAKAFTVQIASLLLTNGIVPIMTEYRKNDLETITDTDRYKLVYELGVTFDSLDTTEHDKQIRAEAFNDVMRLCDAYCHFDKSKHPSNGYVISRASLLDIVAKLKEKK